MPYALSVPRFCETIRTKYLIYALNLVKQLVIRGMLCIMPSLFLGFVKQSVIRGIIYNI